jgi:hypothetical protein
VVAINGTAMKSGQPLAMAVKLVKQSGPMLELVVVPAGSNPAAEAPVAPKVF